MLSCNISPLYSKKKKKKRKISPPCRVNGTSASQRPFKCRKQSKFPVRHEPIIMHPEKMLISTKRKNQEQASPHQKMSSTYKSVKDAIFPISFGMLPVNSFHMKSLPKSGKIKKGRASIQASYRKLDILCN